MITEQKTIDTVDAWAWMDNQGLDAEAQNEAWDTLVTEMWIPEGGTLLLPLGYLIDIIYDGEDGLPLEVHNRLFAIEGQYRRGAVALRGNRRQPAAT